MQTEILAVVLSSALLFAAVNVQAMVNTTAKGTAWIFSNREDQDLPELSRRATRALANHIENMALFVPIALAVVVTDSADGVSALGAWLFIGARLLYIPIYVLGVTYLRSLLWMVGVAGTALVAWPLLASLVG
ncbi:MAG: MAPEG family protein [Myxococcota bacterium]